MGQLNLILKFLGCRSLPPRRIQIHFLIHRPIRLSYFRLRRLQNLDRPLLRNRRLDLLTLRFHRYVNRSQNQLSRCFPSCFLQRLTRENVRSLQRRLPWRLRYGLLPRLNISSRPMLLDNPVQKNPYPS